MKSIKSISFILTIILWPLNDSFEPSDNHLTPIMHLRVEHVKHGGIWIYWLYEIFPTGSISFWLIYCNRLPIELSGTSVFIRALWMVVSARGRQKRLFDFPKKTQNIRSVKVSTAESGSKDSNLHHRRRLPLCLPEPRDNSATNNGRIVAVPHRTMN